MFAGVTAGELIRTRRSAYGLTQEQLARRAGTTQAALSRLERGELSPTVATLERLLGCLGEELELGAHRSALQVDRDHLRDHRNRVPSERLALAMSWNRLAGELSRTGAEAGTRERR